MHTTFRFSNYFKILTIYGSASNYNYATLLTSVKVHEGWDIMKRYRYFIITMIVIMTMINYIDRVLFHTLKRILSKFGFDTIAWGSILGYFGYGYMFGSLLGVLQRIRTEICMDCSRNCLVISRNCYGICW